MSHEIRTPMNGIMGFAEMLQENNLPHDRIKFYSNIVYNSGKQLLRIIDDILEISKLETKQVKVYETKFCLNDFMLELFSIFQIKAKEKKLSLYLKNGLVDSSSGVLTDKAKLNKILSNLIENAIKYTNNGYVEIGYKVVNQRLEIFVKDTGIGIAKGNHDIIFERFSQEDNSIVEKDGGLGLGLAIVKENTELLEGTVELESLKGKGTTFFVNIPYKPAVTSSCKQIETTDLESDNSIKTLIAEDEEVNFLFLEALLLSFDIDFKIFHAKNGIEAVELSKKYNFDIILMDIKMPEMNGYDATGIIKKLFPELPIIAQTAYSTIDDIQLALDAGCDDFISKPIDKNKMLKILSKYIKVS